jgi:hypothetical protein
MHFCIVQNYIFKLSIYIFKLPNLLIIFISIYNGELLKRLKLKKNQIKTIKTQSNVLTILFRANILN